jgi:hypothetical protein
MVLSWYENTNSIQYESKVCVYIYIYIYCHMLGVYIYIVTCWVCDTPQITSRRFGTSEFIPHSLLHIHNLQFHNHRHRQYHNYFSCWSHFHLLDTT